MRKVSKFQKAVATYKCHRCGKLTRETGENESAYNLCLDCFIKCESEEK